MEPKVAGVAQILYEVGLAQYKRPVNNRDGTIQDSRREMGKLRSCLKTSEAESAKRIGDLLATSGDNVEQRRIAQTEYDQLPPLAQTYAQHKRREHETQRTIARDLEKGVPRTDYTDLRRRISSGTMSLGSILAELPIPWQGLPTLGSSVEKPLPSSKPPRKEFIHVIFVTKERGELEDKRAERDGEWIISNRHDMMVPYHEPAVLLEYADSLRAPVPVGKAVIFSSNPTSEWETEFWRQGGRLDQTYLRARAGKDPEELRNAYRRLQIKRALWAVAGAMIVSDMIIVAVKYL